MKSSVKFKKVSVSFIFNQRKQIVINRCHTQSCLYFTECRLKYQCVLNLNLTYSDNYHAI